ncbi:MAG: FAD:protein FMN transferase [Ruminococcaceae bacterium]|nr:FAD:protein FMN transferase [Oscillospiraceae bacterium]
MQKILKRPLALLLCALLMLPLYSCTGRQKKYSESYFGYFDSFAEFTVYTDSKEDFLRYSEIVEQELKKYHELLDAYNEYGNTVNIYTLNERAAHEPVALTAELFDFLLKSKEMHELTSGYTSITLGALTRVWKDAIKAEAVPSEDVLLAAAEHTDIDDLILDEESHTVRFRDEKLKLDAGALGKGYAADRIAKTLVANGCDAFLLNLGGTLAARGKKPDDTPWQAGIQAPDGSELDGISIDLSRFGNKTNVLSTSGSYHRGFRHGGVLYHHIIDPFTLMPENSFTSVSVNCDSATVADALSTALFSMPLDEGQALVESLENTDAVWLLADGSVIKSSN